MSILIKGMEMPTSIEKPLQIKIYPNGDVYRRNRGYGGWRAVPVPPHGRLIDADALIKELALDDEDGNSGATLLMAIFLEVLKAAPTIIEAEEGET